MDAKGGVCCRSSKFTFSFPKPLEELVTLEEEQQEGEEGATDMLLVVPRAELLQVSETSVGETLLLMILLLPLLLLLPSHAAVLSQSRLQECLRERAELLQLQEGATRLREKERAEFRRTREAWDRSCRELKSDISRLQEELRQSRERMEEMERMQKVACGREQETGNIHAEPLLK